MLGGHGLKDRLSFSYFMLEGGQLQRKTAATENTRTNLKGLYTLAYTQQSDKPQVIHKD